MRIPMVRFWRDDTPDAWWDLLFAPVVVPVLLAYLVVLAGLSLLAVPVLVFRLWRRERRFARLTRERGRFVPWAELKPRLQNGDGTLIVEQAHLAGVRVWWTPGDATREAPVSPPAEEELDYMRFGPTHPFVSWCAACYLSDESGRGLLTAPPYRYPPGCWVEEAFFRKRFPEVRVVMTVKLT